MTKNARSQRALKARAKKSLRTAAGLRRCREHFVFCEALFYDREYVERPSPGTAAGLVTASFRLHRLVGRGSFGRAFVASASHGGLCVLKVVARRAGEDVRIHLCRLLRERDSLLRARGPHTPRLFASFFDPNLAAVFVQEYIDGGSLSYVKRLIQADTGCALAPVLEDVLVGERGLREVPVLSERQASVAVFYLAELLAAVRFLHLRGVLHGDLKENNVLVTCSGHLKLIDLGLATRAYCPRPHGPLCAAPHRCVSTNLLNTHISGLRPLWGNRHYAAPELVSYTRVVFLDKDDYWAVGVLLFHLLFGCRPYRRGDKGADLLQSVRDWRTQSFMQRDVLARRCRDHPDMLAAFFCLIADDELRLSDAQKDHGPRWAPYSWPIFKNFDISELWRGPAPIHIPSNSKALSISSFLSADDIRNTFTDDYRGSSQNYPYFTYLSPFSNDLVSEDNI